MRKFLLALLVLLLPALVEAAERELKDSPSITWDFDTPGQVTGHVVPSMAVYFNARNIRRSSDCTAPVEVSINSGPPEDIFTCASLNTAIFYGSTWLPIAITTATFTLTVNDVDSSSQVFAGSFSAQCRPNDAAANNTWGTGQSVSITMATANDYYSATSAAVTPDGTCGAGGMLNWRFVVAGTGSHTDDGDARILGVGMAGQ